MPVPHSGSCGLFSILSGGFSPEISVFRYLLSCQVRQGIFIVFFGFSIPANSFSDSFRKTPARFPREKSGRLFHIERKQSRFMRCELRRFIEPVAGPVKQ